MKVITIGNVKGGVGKSTIACNLAVEATRVGKKVLLIDSDTQQSSIDFRATRVKKGLPEFQIVSIIKNTIHTDVESFEDFDFIFIDTGGRDTAIFRSAVLASDLFLIPVLPSQYDIWATVRTVETIEEARPFKDINACFVINQVIPNTTVAKEALQALKDFKIPILNTKIHARVAFKQSISEGKGVTEYEVGRKNAKASKELVNLFQEVLKCL